MIVLALFFISLIIAKVVVDIVEWIIDLIKGK